MIPLLHPKSAYQHRRARFAESLVPNRDLVIFWNAPERVRNFDAGHAYRPESSFFYLTGFAEPESAFLMWKETGKGGAVRLRFELFVLPRDPAAEQWDGYRYGLEGARKLTGADDAHKIEDLEEAVDEWLHDVPPAGASIRILTNVFKEKEQRAELWSMIDRVHFPEKRNCPLVREVRDANVDVRTMRLVKEEVELKVLREAARINVAAHLKLMHELRPGLREFEARAILEGEYLRQGALDLAYGTIAASGPNATILHYRADTRICRAGELLLVDAGCEYFFHASDITRTLPVSGTYSREQRLIMDLVMEAHTEAMRQVRPGNPYRAIHVAASECLREGLRKLKLLPKGVPHTRYYPHGTGHWMGLDVHDPAPYVDAKGEPIKQQAGMVFTVEPGLYFLPNDRTVPKEFRGIGVRIEDDVVVSARGKPEVLTAGLPRTATEIEKAMR
jgi:Xaa-Pro aminopeptidase